MLNQRSIYKSQTHTRHQRPEILGSRKIIITNVGRKLAVCIRDPQIRLVININKKDILIGAFLKQVKYHVPNSIEDGDSKK
jgi:hypothetical protein